MNIKIVDITFLLSSNLFNKRHFDIHFKPNKNYGIPNFVLLVVMLSIILTIFENLFDLVFKWTIRLII